MDPRAPDTVTFPLDPGSFASSAVLSRRSGSSLSAHTCSCLHTRKPARGTQSQDESHGLPLYSAHFQLDHLLPRRQGQTKDFPRRSGSSRAPTFQMGEELGVQTHLRGPVTFTGRQATPSTSHVPHPSLSNWPQYKFCILSAGKSNGKNYY